MYSPSKSDTLLDWYSSWRRSIGGIGGGKIEQCNRDGGGNGNKCGARVKYVSMHEPESPRTRDDDIPKRFRKPQVVLPTVMCPQVETGGSNQCSAVLGQDESKVEQESLLAQGNIRVLLLINGIYAVSCGVHLFDGFTYLLGLGWFCVLGTEPTQRAHT